MNSNIFFSDRKSLLFALGLFFLTMPFFVWHIPQLSYIKLLVSIIVVVMAFNRQKKHTDSDNRLIVLFVFTGLYYIFLSFFHDILNLNGIITSFIIVLFYCVSFIEDRFLRDVFVRFSNLYTVLIGLSLLCWFLAIAGLLPSMGTIEHYNPMVHRTYNTYPFVIIEYFSDEGIRFSGLYDEPGSVGTLSALLLCLQGFNMKDWKTYILLLSGIFSMSFFFYALVPIYWIFYLISKKKSKGIVPVLLITIAFVLFYSKTQNNEFMSERLWSRFEWDASEGKFLGDNRITDEADIYFAKIRGTREYFFGVDDVTGYWKAAEGSSSYKNVIAMYGLVFFVFYVMFFILLAKKYCIQTSSLILFLFVFFLNLYQRSNIYSMPFIFLYAYLARWDSLKYIEIKELQ